MNKNFATSEIVTIVSYLNENLTDDKTKVLPTKFRWNLKKNLDKLVPIAQRFDAFREGLIKELRENFFSEEKSEEYAETVKDDDGNAILDEDGNEQTTMMRRVKSEYMDDYKKTVADLNDKLSEILAETNSIEISTVDFDDFVNNLSDNSLITFDDLSILCFMDETTNLSE